MKVCALTCTGKRPLMMPLHLRWVMAQKRKPDVWIISLGEDEDLGVTDLPDFARVHRWKHAEIGRGMKGHIDANTKFFYESLHQVPDGHAVVHFDDDDWIGPEYVSTVYSSLRDNHFTGNGLEARYCLRTNRWMLISKPSCNTGASAFRPECLQDWIEWQQDPSTKWPDLAKKWRVNLRNGAPRVSMKNGPGIGHLFPPADRKWRQEKDGKWSMLRSWIGDDADHYIRLMESL